MRAFYTCIAEQISTIEHHAASLMASAAAAPSGLAKAKAASDQRTDSDPDAKLGTGVKGGPAGGATRRNEQPGDTNAVRGANVDPNNPNGRVAEAGRFTDGNRQGVAQVDEGTDPLLKDQAANPPPSGSDVADRPNTQPQRTTDDPNGRDPLDRSPTSQSTPVVQRDEDDHTIVVTQYGARHRIDDDDLSFAPSIGERKLPTNGNGDPAGEDSEWGRVRSGDWLVTYYDVRDDEVIHKIYDDATFTTYFRAALQG